MTETKTLEEIFTRFAPPYGESWEEELEKLYTDPFDRETIELLREELRRDGQFHTPIWLHADDEDGTLSVANGMHRISAARLEGRREIPITWEPETGDEPTYEIEFTTNAEYGNDALYSALISFKIDDIWVECPVLGAHLAPGGTIISGYWTWGGDPERLVTGIRERLMRYGWTFEVKKIEIFEYDEEEDVA